MGRARAVEVAEELVGADLGHELIANTPVPDSLPDGIDHGADIGIRRSAPGVDGLGGERDPVV